MRRAKALAKHGRIHTFIATSPIHMKHKLGKEPDQVLQMAVDAVRYAKGLAPEVEFSAEDASRSDYGFLSEIIQAVIEAGASIINLPDTTGYAVPGEYMRLFKEVIEKTPNADKAIFSVHCHNDLGMAVANSLAGVLGGARQVEVSVNGIGERCIEEIVMALSTRKDSFQLETGIKTEEIFRTSKLLSTTIGFPIPANKAIVGKNAFAHESGIHQDGVLKERSTYEIMTPESIGRKSSDIVLGRHSGKHGFTKKLAELGYEPDKDALEKAWMRFTEVADKKKEVFDDDLVAIVEDALHASVPETWKLEYVNFTGNNSIRRLPLSVRNGERFRRRTGDGPDAIYGAINRIVNVRCP